MITLYIILGLLIMTIITPFIFTIWDIKSGDFELDNFLFMICVGLPIPTHLTISIINFLLNQ